MNKLDKEVKDIIKNIQSYENEEICIIILSQKQNKALLNYINILEKDKEEIERLNNVINVSRRILGEYKHFSTPTEEQNSENEDIVDKAYLTLHGNLRK